MCKDGERRVVLLFSMNPEHHLTIVSSPVGAETIKALGGFTGVGFAGCLFAGVPDAERLQMYST